MTIPCPVEYVGQPEEAMRHPANCPGGCGSTGAVPSSQALSKLNIDLHLDHDGMGNIFEAAIWQADRIVELEQQVALLRKVCQDAYGLMAAKRWLQLEKKDAIEQLGRPVIDALKAALAQTKEKP